MGKVKETKLNALNMDELGFRLWEIFPDGKGFEFKSDSMQIVQDKVLQFVLPISGSVHIMVKTYRPEKGWGPLILYDGQIPHLYKKDEEVHIATAVGEELEDTVEQVRRIQSFYGIFTGDSKEYQIRKKHNELMGYRSMSSALDEISDFEALKDGAKTW